MILRLTLLCGTFAICGCWDWSRQGPASGPPASANGAVDLATPPDIAHDAETESTEIRRLIDDLASKNSEPVQRGSSGDRRLAFPGDYDKHADEVVKSAGDKLISYGTAAFPMLIEHFQDERFSHVIDTPAGEMTAPVSRACRSIIECQLEVYEKAGSDDTYPWMPPYFEDVVEKDGAAH
ncbi:MAG: hypothetical protein JSS02_19275, partial [Planctomycetes bacterium]|nr:hypothetical protein [Planctomycetota bacterium]